MDVRYGCDVRVRCACDVRVKYGCDVRFEQMERRWKVRIILQRCTAQV